MSGGPVGDLPQPGHLLEEGVDLVHRGASFSGKHIAQLLWRPSRGRMFGDRHVDDPSTFVREDHEYEQQP